MSTNPAFSSRSTAGQALKLALIVLAVGTLFAAALAALWASQTQAGAVLGNSLSSLFAVDTVQSWWYVTRAAGLTSYFLLWLSMVWGMAISTKFFHPAVDGSYSYDFHEFLSLLGLGFVLVHVVVLPLDKYLPFNLLQILVPFVDTYRPLWVGLGIIGFYIFLLVTITFYIRKLIGTKAFRCIHMLSLLGYVGATLHGLFAGTDSALPITQVLYVGSALVVVFLTAYWIVLGALTKRARAVAAAQAAALKRQPQRMQTLGR